MSKHIRSRIVNKHLATFQSFLHQGSFGKILRR